MKQAAVSEQTGRDESFYAEKGPVQGPRGRKELGRCKDLSGIYCWMTTCPQTVAWDNTTHSLAHERTPRDVSLLLRVLPAVETQLELESPSQGSLLMWRESWCWLPAGSSARALILLHTAPHGCSGFLQHGGWSPRGKTRKAAALSKAKLRNGTVLLPPFSIDLLSHKPSPNLVGGITKSEEKASVMGL